MSRKDKSPASSSVTKQKQRSPKEQLKPSEEISLETLFNNEEHDLSGKDFLIGMISQSFQGPIPSPKTLREYTEIDPSLLDWFKERAAKASALEESIARAEIEANLEKNRYRKRGQWIAFAIVLIFLAGGLLLIFTGHTTPGTILAAAGTLTAALARLFIQGEGSAQKKAPQEKKKPKKA